MFQDGVEQSRDSLVEVYNQQDRLEEGLDKSAHGMDQRHKVIVVPDLPDSRDTEHSGVEASSSRWLLTGWNITSVPRFIQEEDQGDGEENVHGKSQPDDRPPLSKPGQHEIAKERSEIGRRDEETSPQSDLPGAFVEKEHVL